MKYMWNMLNKCSWYLYKNPANIYLFKVTKEMLEKDVKYIQS